MLWSITADADHFRRVCEAIAAARLDGMSFGTQMSAELLKVHFSPSVLRGTYFLRTYGGRFFIAQLRQMLAQARNTLLGRQQRQTFDV